MILRSQNQQFFFKDQRGLPNLIYRTPLKYFDLAGGEQFEDPGFTYPTISQLQEIEAGNYDFEVKSCVKLMDSKTLSKKVAKLQSDMGYLKQLYFKKQYLEQLKEK